MASEASSTPKHGSDDSSAAEVPVEQLAVNLKVVSPNMTKQLVFEELPAATTVAELKDTIRQSLPPRLAEGQQRLIYRGRMLNRPEQKLLDIFGEDMIRSSEQQSIHLVLPDLPEKSSLSSSTTPVRGQSPAPVHRGPDALNNAHQYFDSVLQQGARHMARRVPTASTTTTHLPTTTQPTTGNPSVTQPAHAHDHHHHQLPHTHHAAPPMYRGSPIPTQFAPQGFQMAQRLNWEAARQRAYMNQWDRGAGGARFNSATQPPGANHPEATHRRLSPAPHAHEGQAGQENHSSQRPRVAPGGVEAPLTDAEVQTILRGADARHAIVTMTNAMQRSASGASLGPQSGRATPSHAFRTVSSSTTGATAGSSQAASASQPGASEVYILYSPTGPRGLLINNHSETYYTPQVRPTPTQGLFSASHLSPIRRDIQPQAGLQSQAVPPPGQHHEQNQDGLDRAAAQNGLRRRGRVAVQAPHRVAAVRRGNPGAAAMVARVWPHFWLAVKLSLFVWWFTSPGSSWSRWLILISIAITIFILNIGALDSVAEHIWRAVCRHMENLIPMAAPNAQGPQGQNAPQNANQNQNAPDAGQQGAQPGGAGPGHPAGMAARLVQDRRQANANWLMDRVRRMERAGLLFLASIAPGVAERHIANIEAEMERLRREAEAAEAEAAAEEARRREADGEVGEEAPGAGGAEDVAEMGEISAATVAREGPEGQEPATGLARDPPPLAEPIPM